MSRCFIYLGFLHHGSNLEGIACAYGCSRVHGNRTGSELGFGFWLFVGNFDVINDTGSVAHGFEIDLEGLHSSDITDHLRVAWVVASPSGTRV